MKSLSFKTAKKIHICNGCEKVIECDEKYWSAPYKCLCVECYAVQQQSNSQQFKPGEPCKYCGKPSIVQAVGFAVCKTHIGDAVETVERGMAVDKGESEVE